MYFKVNRNWEIDFGGIDAIFGEPGAKRYPCVTLSLNSYLFHVDVYYYNADEQYYSFDRWIFSNIDYLLGNIDNPEISDVVISLQSRKQQRHCYEYEICTLVKIDKITSNNGAVNYMYECCNGNKYYEYEPIFNKYKQIETVYLANGTRSNLGD